LSGAKISNIFVTTKKNAKILAGLRNKGGKIRQLTENNMEKMGTNLLKGQKYD
jgi:hypothetical protein